MKTLTVLMLAAAATGVGDKPHVPNMLFRNHVVQHGAPPPGGPIMMPPGGADAGAGSFGAAGRRFPNDTSQVYFVDPPGMQIGWQTSGGGGMQRTYLPAQLTVPARYNFRQGYIYRLKVGNIPGRPGLVLYPTLEIAPSAPATDAYLTHNPIPAQFTEEDFDQVTAGNFVTKVIYLPDPKYQELAIAGVETLVSTRLEPGIDPILEADRRGTILMILRVGAIDLEMPATGASFGGPNGVPAFIDGNVTPVPVLSQPTVAPETIPPSPAPDSAPAAPVTPTDESTAPPPAPADETVPAEEPAAEPAAPPTASARPRREPGVLPASLPPPSANLPIPEAPPVPDLGDSGLPAIPPPGR